jgi:hypothetical protein
MLSQCTSLLLQVLTASHQAADHADMRTGFALIKVVGDGQSFFVFHDSSSDGYPINPIWYDTSKLCLSEDRF